MSQTLPKVINNSFVIKKKISQGSFGVVYQGQDIKTKELMAIKVEKPEVDQLLSLEREISILQHLHGTPNVPRLRWAGKEAGFNVMVQQFLGRDLTHYLRQRKRFSLSCVLYIADQMLSVLENVHDKGVVHRDLKPENILLGLHTECSMLYLVDYGISKQFKDADDKHMQFKEGKAFLGTTRYASVAAHKGQEISRKDDLESLGYVFVFLLKGSLPWQNVQCNTESEKAKLVGQMKMRMSAHELCKDLPSEFARFIDMARKMSFRQHPDYRYFQQMFKRLAVQQQLIVKLDWEEVELRVTSPTKQHPKHEQSILMKQIYSPQKPQLDECEIDYASKRGEQGRNSLISPLQDRNSMRHRSTSSYAESMYSDPNPDGSVMVAFHKRQQFGSFHNNNSAEIVLSQFGRSCQSAHRLHKNSFEFKGAPQTSIAEINLGLMRQLSMDPTIRNEQGLNEDESPGLDDKFQLMRMNSVQITYKNPIQINRQNYEQTKKIMKNIQM